MQRTEYQRKPKRKTKKQVAEERDSRLIVAWRSQGRCEARLPTVCLGRASEYHHRVLRSQKRDERPENILHLCGPGGCHHWAHHNVARAGELGLLLKSWQDPKTTPIVRVDGSEVWL